MKFFLSIAGSVWHTPFFYSQKGNLNVNIVSHYYYGMGREAVWNFADLKVAEKQLDYAVMIGISLRATRWMSPFTSYCPIFYRNVDDFDATFGSFLEYFTSDVIYSDPLQRRIDVRDLQKKFNYFVTQWNNGKQALGESVVGRWNKIF